MPRVVDHDRRRADVTSAARTLIAREGFDATTIRRVAAEIGSSTTAITHYFADKEAMLVAVIQDAWDALTPRIAELADSSPVGLATVRMLLLAALPLDADRAAEAKVWLAFWSAATTRPDLRQVQRDGYAAFRALLENALEQARERNEIAANSSVAMCAEQLTLSVDGLLVQATLEPDRLPPPRQIAMVDDMLSRLRR